MNCSPVGHPSPSMTGLDILRDCKVNARATQSNHCQSTRILRDSARSRCFGEPSPRSCEDLTDSSPGMRKYKFRSYWKVRALHTAAGEHTKGHITNYDMNTLQDACSWKHTKQETIPFGSSSWMLMLHQNTQLPTRRNNIDRGEPQNLEGKDQVTGTGIKQVLRQHEHFVKVACRM